MQTQTKQCKHLEDVRAIRNNSIYCNLLDQWVSEKYCDNCRKVEYEAFIEQNKNLKK